MQNNIGKSKKKKNDTFIKKIQKVQLKIQNKRIKVEWDK